MAGPIPAPNRYDQMAQQHGFQNFSQMQNWYMKTHNVVMQPGADTSSSVSGMSPNDAANTAMSWHPAWILDYVNQKLKAALGGQ